MKLLNLILLVGSVASYNTPFCPGWPSENVWNSELGSALTPQSVLHGPIPDSQSEAFFVANCTTHGTNAYQISASGNGICMHAYACAYQFCREENAPNLPIYVLEAKTLDDISAALVFAEKYDIAVSVKSTGHSYQGSSTNRYSLLIWMQNYPTDDTVKFNHTDSCGTVFDTVVGINGGETFDGVLAAVSADYNIVAGGGRTVSPSGGWLQGVGLSFSSREYGTGVDNVVSFNVVLANGTQVLADACTNPDLFWALRGGGGGTFGVVTHIEYKLHKKTPVTVLAWGLLGTPPQTELGVRFVSQWLTYWIQESPKLESRWSGFFSPFGCHLVFLGTIAEAKTSFVNRMNLWYFTVLDISNFAAGVWGAFPPADTLVEFNSWFEYRGGQGAVNNPDETDATGDAYRGVETLGARLVPVDVLMEKPGEMLNLLMNLTLAGETIGVNYFLGGNMMKVPTNATAVHPAMRRAIWSIHYIGPRASQLVRDFLPNNVTGASFNHHDPIEPDWPVALWGPHYDQLLQIKNKYDPNHRFNCWHCVGYRGDQYGVITTLPIPTCPTLAPTMTPATPAPISPHPTDRPISAAPIVPLPTSPPPTGAPLTTPMPTIIATPQPTIMATPMPTSGGVATPTMSSLFWSIGVSWVLTMCLVC